MNKNWNTIEVLRHARHDWLNKIQLIKGNLSLNKVDRVKEIIDEIIVETQQEAKLSNMKIPQFASLLLTYNWENHPFQVEYDVLDYTICDYLDDELLVKWTCSFFSCLNATVKKFNENHLSVTIAPQKEGVRFFFDFRGIITEKEPLEQLLNKETTVPTLNVLIFTEQELSLELFFQYSK
ncbi:sporulation initiation phosphotransferase B [Bacillus sp. Bva_UNVM-123]|uniref:Spo0B C-terminal domain-containing protein n=1 Tax=Bacillus sp. Bva_UNVM-123 TaxID=2829798 RepID=UPI00391F71EB